MMDKQALQYLASQLARGTVAGTDTPEWEVPVRLWLGSTDNKPHFRARIVGEDRLRRLLAENVVEQIRSSLKARMPVYIGAISE